MKSLTASKEYQEGVKKVGPGSEFRYRCIYDPIPISREENESDPSNANYNGYRFKESDWKLYRQRLPEWQERFMGELINGYAELMKGDGKASDRFWELNERIGSDVKKVGVSAYMSRSLMATNLTRLLWEGAISFSDLDGFSQELVGWLRYLSCRPDDDVEADITKDI